MRARTSSPVELNASELGRFARLALARPARVVARFERSCYVASSAGIACLGGSGLDSGPLNVIVPSLTRMPPLGAEVSVCTRGARLWRPPQPVRIPAARPRRLPMAQARGIFSVMHPAAGALREWLAKAARGSAPRSLGTIIGMGPGLTPAGDDFVGGALIALRATRRHACAARLGAWAMKRAARNTNRISRAHLACAAQGEGGSALHALLNALIAGTRDISTEIAAIDAVGHSSGWDAAAGAALVLELATPPRTPRARSRAPATRRARR